MVETAKTFDGREQPRRATGLSGLPPVIWLLASISLLNDAASDMLYPLIPLYLASVLASGPARLGIIEGIAEATGSLLKLFSGIVVDRTKKSKPWVVFGYTLAGLSRPLIAFANSWIFLLGIRFADRVGKGLRSSPRDALMAKSIQPSQRGLAFGLHRAMDNAGAVIGPLVAAAILASGVPLKQVFLWAFIPGILTVILALAIKEPTEAPSVSKKHEPFKWSLAGLPLPLRRYLLALALFTLGNSSNMFLLMRAKEIGLPQAHVPLLWATVSLMATIFSTPLSALSDRLGRTTLIAAGWIAYAVFYAALATIPGQNLFLLFGLFAFYGVSIAAIEGAEKALVADLAPTAVLGRAYGWFHLTNGVMLLPASLVFGFFYERLGALTAFSFSAGCALGGTVLLLIIPREKVQQ